MAPEQQDGTPDGAEFPQNIEVLTGADLQRAFHDGMVQEKDLKNLMTALKETSYDAPHIFAQNFRLHIRHALEPLKDIIGRVSKNAQRKYNNLQDKIHPPYP